MKTIASIDEVQNLIDTRNDIYVRWSKGPEADAANGWISKKYSGTWDDEMGDYDYIPVDEAGLSATVLDDVKAIRRWAGDVYGETCYILSGVEVGLCDDGEPLIANAQPIAYVSI